MSIPEGMTLRRAPLLAIAALVLTLGFAGCSQAGSTSVPSPAPSEKASQPTKAPVTQPTASLAEQPPTATATQRVQFPEKGKNITLIVPFGAGGPTDVVARVLAPILERELGTSIQIVNKPGANQQTGITDLVRAKPDGYTIAAMSLPSLIGVYLNSERQAVFSRKDFQPLAVQVMDPDAIAVSASSPYNTVKDLVEAAKAQPEKVIAGNGGALTVTHLNMLSLERQTGAKFGAVQFQDAPQAAAALVGGHVDAQFQTAATWPSFVQNGKVRVLAVTDEFEFLPGVPTLESLGYEHGLTSVRGYVLPAGTPKAVVDVLASAFKRAMESQEHKERLKAASQAYKYMGPDELAKFWDDQEKTVGPLMELGGAKLVK